MIEKSIPPQRNKSTLFILPMIGISINAYKELINCYIADFTQSIDDSYNFHKIFVQTLVNNDQLKYNAYYVDSYKTPDNTYMYIFDIPVMFQEDYKLFLDGKYSWFSDNYKDFLVSKMPKSKPVQTHNLYKILYRIADARKQVEERIGMKLPINAEIYSSPNIDEETYTYIGTIIPKAEESADQQEA